MTTVNKKISNTEVRVQWSGLWEAFYDGANNGFPGIEIPFELAAILRLQKGMVIQVDTDRYEATAEAAVRTLFESVVGTEGPGNDRWVLMSNAYWTTSNHIRWVGGAADSLAFQIGRQALTPNGKIDPTAPKQSFADAYVFSPARSGTATFWVCFSFQ